MAFKFSYSTEGAGLQYAHSRLCDEFVMIIDTELLF